ncbi:MAG: hypothetical protein U7M05_12245 [Candidatus Igneacidithiobacillus chanchocoensis]
MAEMAFYSGKVTGKYAERLKAYAVEHRLSLSGCAAEMIMRGLDALEAERKVAAGQSADGIEAQLQGMERRLAATVIAMRTDLDALQAETDTGVVMLDALVKSLFVHLPPPPPEEREALTASAMDRYGKYVASLPGGYEQDRPAVLRKIAELLQKRVGDSDETD